MNLKQLEYFVAIAEEGQITAAARRLNISQPPLSYELGKLEDELETKLVVRGPRACTLTEAGQLLYERAVRLLAMAQATKAEVACVGKGMTGCLRLACVPSAAGLVPGARLRELAELYPDVSIEVTRAATGEALELLDAGLVDVAVVRTPFSSEGLRCRYAAAEPMVAVMPAELEAGGEMECGLGDLAGCPLVVARNDHARLEQVFSGQDIDFCCSVQTDDQMSAALWAREGMGVALVARSLIRVADTGECYIKELRCKELETRLAVVWQAQRTLSPLAERAIALLGELA